MQDRPMLDRLTPASHRALMLWCINYALNNRNAITPATLAKMRQGDKAQRQAADLLTRYGLNLTRDTAKN